MPQPNPNAGEPATDKPVAPAVTSAKLVLQPAKAVTADAVKRTDGKQTYTVAPGRSLLHGVGKQVGDLTQTVKTEAIKAGETVELDADEADHLIKAGFLLAPDGSVVIPPDGPATAVDNGVAVTTGEGDGAKITQPA